MKAHGVTTSGNSGPTTPKKNPVKKEKSAGSDKPSAAKKRKLKEVDENAGDEDEPIKGEVKSEVKLEDAITVKTEHSNGGVTAMTAPAAPVSVQPDTAPQADHDDDDDEVLVISSNERIISNAPVYSSHHHHHHSSMSAHHIPDIHSFDYASNLGYHLQTAPTATMMVPAISRASSGNTSPYGFTHAHAHAHLAHNHNSPGFYWQGSNMVPPHSEGYHKEDSKDGDLRRW